MSGREILIRNLFSLRPFPFPSNWKRERDHPLPPFEKKQKQKKVVQNPVRLQPNDSLAHLCVSFLFVYGVQSFGMKEK